MKKENYLVGGTKTSNFVISGVIILALRGLLSCSSVHGLVNCNEECLEEEDYQFDEKETELYDELLKGDTEECIMLNEGGDR